MGIIKIITEKNFDRLETPDKWDGYRIRHGARAVLLDETSRIALMHVSKQNYYKLPGGGVDPGEDTEMALRRELLEEVGCTDINIITDLGEVYEYRDQWEMKAEHHGFIVKKSGDIISPSRTEKEIDNGHETVWADGIDQAIKLVEFGKSFVDEYGQWFEIERELAFLNKAKNAYFVKEKE